MPNKNLPQIFVINLTKDTHKKVKISKLLQSLNLEFTILQAVNGDDLSALQISKVVNQKETVKKSQKRTINWRNWLCAQSYWCLEKNANR